ncbi:kinase-like domain-containing protein [Morchella snyderi]|nr:kinase-like domain-containing protein [Morchella snyderi]
MAEVNTRAPPYLDEFADKISMRVILGLRSTLSVIPVLDIIATLIILTAATVFVAHSVNSLMVEKYPGLVSQANQEIALIPPLIRSVEQILQEHRGIAPGETSPTYIPPLIAILANAMSTFHELKKELYHQNPPGRLSLLIRIRHIGRANNLHNIVTRLQDQKNSLHLILTLIPRVQAAVERNERNAEESISAPDMSHFSAAAIQHHLETIFSPDNNSVVHTLTDSHPGLTTATAEWTHKSVVGSGSNGTTVTLQSGPSGYLRAVKRVLGSTATYAKEIDALSAVSDNQDLFVQFLGWYASREFLCIAMEFITNGDLSTYIKSQEGSPLFEGTCREITRQVLKGISVLHQRDICHRDLKPENILVAALDPIHVKITDFGASKRLVNTEARSMVGTIGYIAPELLGVWRTGARNRLYGYPADLWAMGCILYELLSFRRPFDTGASGEMAKGSVSGVCGETPTELDMPSLFQFCYGEDTQTIEALRQYGAGVEAMDVVRAILRADPSSRLSALEALELPWFVSPGEARRRALLPHVLTPGPALVGQSRSEVPGNRLPISIWNERASGSTTTEPTEAFRRYLDTIAE